MFRHSAAMQVHHLLEIAKTFCRDTASTHCVMMYSPLSQHAIIPMAPDDMYEVQEIIYLRWCYYFIVTTCQIYLLYPTVNSECVVYDQYY